MTAHPWGYGGGDVHTVRQCVGEEGIGRERERERVRVVGVDRDGKASSTVAI